MLRHPMYFYCLGDDVITYDAQPNTLSLLKTNSVPPVFICLFVNLIQFHIFLLYYETRYNNLMKNHVYIAESEVLLVEIVWCNF